LFFKTIKQIKMNPGIKKNWIKKMLIIAAILLVAGVGFIWYLFSEKFDDTAKVKAEYSVPAAQLIQEFKTNLAEANKRYTEKIVAVTGRVTGIESADTTINIKMTDTTSGSYIIFAFQSQDMNTVKQIKEGDSISLKGSCSGGEYSNILEAHFINFKRCTIN